MASEEEPNDELGKGPTDPALPEQTEAEMDRKEIELKMQQELLRLVKFLSHLWKQLLELDAANLAAGYHIEICISHLCIRIKRITRCDCKSNNSGYR